MSLKNLYAWNGGSQKNVGTSCGIKRSSSCEGPCGLKRPSGCEFAKSTGCGLATKSTGCEVPCGMKRPSGCGAITKSTGCGMITKLTGCGIVVAPSKR